MEEEILRSRVSELEDENKLLREQVAYLTRKIYGRSSEKTSVVLETQTSLFNEAEEAADPNAAEPTLDDIAGYKRKKKYQGQRDDLLRDLPHVERLITLPEDERICGACGGTMVLMGKEFIRSDINIIPARIEVVDIYRETFECKECRRNGTRRIVKPLMPERLLQHSLASSSSVAWVMHQKYELAVPLNRLEDEWKSLGLSLSRATMANWMIKTSEDWLQPMIDLLHRKLVKEKYLHADETSLQVLHEKGRKSTTDSYMWVYATGRGSRYPIELFDYQPRRSGDNPKEFLKGFHGYLHTDAYSGYTKVNGITRCFCWAHMRRMFRDAIPDEERKNPNHPAVKGFHFCSRLFKEETGMDKQSPEFRHDYRQRVEKPLLDDFFAWVEKSTPNVLPKGKLSLALNYALNQKAGLMNYLKDPNCVISNNTAEQCVRPFTIGRKNWLFSASPKGASASANIYSMVRTAKANGLEPYKYLKFLFDYLPAMDIRRNPAVLEQFLPWKALAQETCMPGV